VLLRFYLGESSRWAVAAFLPNPLFRHMPENPLQLGPISEAFARAMAEAARESGLDQKVRLGLWVYTVTGRWVRFAVV
jgi:hypothetical protein